MPGLDATGDEYVSNNKLGQWKDGHVLTFWAYDYEYPGTTAFHMHGRAWSVQTFYLSLDRIGWDYYFTFWAFKATPRTPPGERCWG